MARSISASELDLPGKGKNWEDKLLSYLQDDVFRLLDEGSHTEAEVVEYNDELVATLGSLCRFRYLSRVERNRALAEGFRLHPKGTCNSDEQIALAREHASHAYSLHKLIEEVVKAIEARRSVGQTGINFLGEQIKNLQ